MSLVPDARPEPGSEPPEGTHGILQITLDVVPPARARGLLYDLVTGLLEGVGIGCIALLVYRCEGVWWQGGSPDPRCVFGWSGYVESHYSDESTPPRVSCEYRPDITRGL